MKVEKAPKRWKSKNAMQVAKQQCPISDSILQRAPLTHPTRAWGDGPASAPSTSSSGPAQASGQGRGDSPWKASVSLWGYSLVICSPRHGSIAWVAPCSIYPLRQELSWGGKQQAKLGLGIKGIPSRHSKQNMMRQPQPGCSAGQSFNRLNNSISTDH